MNINPNYNRRILVIDDNKAIHEDFQKILGRKHSPPSNFAEAEAALFGGKTQQPELPEFQIDSAFQGQEGLDLIQKSIQENRPYAMAFIDVRMPPATRSKVRRPARRKFFSKFKYDFYPNLLK